MRCSQTGNGYTEFANALWQDAISQLSGRPWCLRCGREHVIALLDAHFRAAPALLHRRWISQFLRDASLREREAASCAIGAVAGSDAAKDRSAYCLTKQCYPSVIVRV
jgi:hypothetical protein